MDNFMDKLAQKFNAQEMIKAELSGRSGRNEEITASGSRV